MAHIVVHSYCSADAEYQAFCLNKIFRILIPRPPHPTRLLECLLLHIEDARHKDRSPKKG